ENEFISEVEALLGDIKARMESGIEEQLEDVISFIAIDIDNQGSLANKYGDRMTRNLSRAVGERLKEQLGAIFTKHTDYQLYHVFADRFYLLLRGIPLTQAREDAERLRNVLKGSYQIDAHRILTEQPTLP